MEKQIILRQRQRLPATDLMDMQHGLRSTFDELIRSAVGDGNYYTGYEASGSLFELTLQPGRVFIDGRMYQSLSSTVFAQELFNRRPVANQRIISVVGSGAEIESTESGAAAEPRQFAIDAINNVYETQMVTTRNIRRAQIDLINGVEHAQPEVPTTPSNSVLIATVLMNPSGIVSISMNPLGLLPQAERNAMALAVLQDFLETQVLRIDTLVSDFSAIRSYMDTLASKTSVIAIRAVAEEALARANAAFSMAENAADFLRDFEDRYTDTRFSDVDAAGYAAIVGSGLHFPRAASSTLTNGIELFNAIDPRVMVNNDLILPAYEHRLRMDTFGQGKVARQAALQAYTSATHTVQATVPAENTVAYSTRKGNLLFRVPVAAGDPITLHGVQLDTFGSGGDIPLNATTEAWALRELAASSFAGMLAKEAARPDFRIVRLVAKRMISAVNVLAHYESVVETSPVANGGKPTYVQTTTSTHDGQGRAESWLQERDGWLTRVGLFFSARGASGDVRLLVTAVDSSGAPDMKQTPVNVVVPWADIRAAPISSVSPDGIETLVNIPPVLLSGGRRYAINVISSGDHYVRMTEGVTQMTQGEHWALSDANKFVRPSMDTPQTMAFRLYFARFASTKVEVDLKPLSLAGGIHDISVKAQMVVPELTALAFEVQPDGTNWRVLGPTSGQRLAADLTGGPELLPFRVVFEGTQDIMPALARGSSKSTVTSSRPALAMVHQSTTIDVGSGSTSNLVKVIHLLENFDVGDHTFTVTLIGDPEGTPVTHTATTTTDVTLDDGVVSRTTVFDINSNEKQTYAIRVTGASTGPLDKLFSIGSVYAAFYDEP